METHSLSKLVAESARQKAIREAWEVEDVQESLDAYHTGKAMGKKAFKTKDSGKRVKFESGMQRDTSEGKPRFDLITPLDQGYEQSMVYRWAALMARGAEKYGDRNWEKASTQAELKRFKESTYRHFMQWYHGEVDEDHAAAVYFNIAGTEYVKTKLAMDKVVLDTLGVKPLESPEHRACR